MKWILLILMIIFAENVTGQKDECDYSVLIMFNESQNEGYWKIYAERVSGESTNISSIVKVREGDNANHYYPWTNSRITNQKTSREYKFGKAKGIFVIEARINTTCPDINEDNNFDIKSISYDEVPIDENGEEMPINGFKPKPYLNEDVKSHEDKCANFESNNQKINNFSVFILLGVSLVLNIILIWKR